MQEQDPPMFNKFIFDECFIFILLIQFHLHLISFHQRFPHQILNPIITTNAIRKPLVGVK